MPPLLSDLWAAPFFTLSRWRDLVPKKAARGETNLKGFDWRLSRIKLGAANGSLELAGKTQRTLVFTWIWGPLIFDDSIVKGGGRKKRIICRQSPPSFAWLQ